MIRRFDIFAAWQAAAAAAGAQAYTALGDRLDSRDPSTPVLALAGHAEGNAYRATIGVWFPDTAVGWLADTPAEFLAWEQKGEV